MMDAGMPMPVLVWRFHRSHFFTSDEIEIPTKLYPNFGKISMFKFSKIYTSIRILILVLISIFNFN
jgi:hypothetical protein